MPRFNLAPATARNHRDLRRLLAQADIDERTLRVRREELEAHLVAVPSLDWSEAAEKARYVLRLFAATPIGQDPRRQRLIANVLDDFTHLSLRMAEGTASK